MKINWKQKLTSRKFWIAIIGFVTPLLIAFGISESTATEIAGIIMAGAACIAYIMGEGIIDAECTARIDPPLYENSPWSTKNEGESK